MYSFLDNFIWYWGQAGWEKIFETFWYFFILEVPRFLLMDLLILILALSNKLVNRKKYTKARNEFFAENPLISIVVPGKNEGKHIYKLANTLNEQTYKNFELIIIDDGSTDDTYQICSNLHKNGYIDRYFRNDERGGKASAANLGLRFANGKFLVHLDADTSYDRDALEKIIIPFYLNKKMGGVGGNVKVRNMDKSLATGFQALEYLQTIMIGRTVTSYLGIYRIISGAFGAFRTDALKRIGGWDIGPGLDGDISVKLRKLGYKIHFEARAICLTNAPEKFKALSKQRLRWSKSLVRFRLRKHKDVFYPNANFNLLNFASFLENIIYNIILDALWFYYIIWIILTNISILEFIIPMKILLYTVSTILQFLIIMSLSERRRAEFKLIIYVPLMFIYTGYYMRIIRTIAYIKEFLFYSSYKDPWNPEKTSIKAKELGL